MSVKAKGLEVKMQGDTAEVMLNGYIGNGDNDTINYQSFIDSINSFKGAGIKNCNVSINSGGGDCFNAFAIYDAAKASGINFDCRIVGMCASAGTILMFMGKQKPLIAKNAFGMIHPPQGGEYGEARALSSMADLLTKMEARIVKLYMDESGKDEATVKSWMVSNAPTWMDADEMVANGLARGIIDPVKATAIANIKSMKPRDAFQVFAKLFTEEPTTLNENQHTGMKLPKSTLKQLNITGVDENTDIEASQVVTAVNALHIKAKRLDVLEAEIEAEKETAAARVIDAAVKARKITAGERDDMVELYKQNPTLVEKMLKGKEEVKPINARIVQKENQTNPDAEVESFVFPKAFEGKTFKQLQREKGGDKVLMKMKKEAPNLFEQMQVEDYGKVVIPA